MHKLQHLPKFSRGLALLLATVMAACSTIQEPTIQIENRSNDVVAAWDEVAASAINQPPLPTGTLEEQQPNYAVDMATVHLAIHDAVVAITGGYPALVVKPTSATRRASPEAAASAAAFSVLKALFPSRTDALQAAYDKALAAVPDGEARASGIGLGTEVGAAVIAARSGDGRIQSLPSFVPGSAPGAYRGPALVGRNFAFI